jgi:hypothetical protein
MMHVPSLRPFAGLLATEHATHPHHAHFVKHKHQHHAWLQRKSAETRRRKSALRLTPHHRPLQAFHAIQHVVRNRLAVALAIDEGQSVTFAKWRRSMALSS